VNASEEERAGMLGIVPARVARERSREKAQIRPCLLLAGACVDRFLLTAMDQRRAPCGANALRTSSVIAHARGWTTHQSQAKARYA
jgi:hypothetical protein